MMQIIDLNNSREDDLPRDNVARKHEATRIEGQDSSFAVHQAGNLKIGHQINFK